MMKRSSVLVVLVILLSVSPVWFAGCRCTPPMGGKGCAQLGETEAEGNRRHIRNARINHEQMIQDIDKFFLLDKPSTLNELTIP